MSRNKTYFHQQLQGYKLITTVAIALAIVLVLSTDAGAQGIISSGIDGCDFTTGELTKECIPNFLAHFIKWLAGFLGIIFLGVIIFAGYEIAISGLTQQRESGKYRLLFGIVGFLVSVMAFAIIDFIIQTLGS